MYSVSSRLSIACHGVQPLVSSKGQKSDGYGPKNSQFFTEFSVHKAVAQVKPADNSANGVIDSIAVEFAAMFRKFLINHQSLV